MKLLPHLVIGLAFGVYLFTASPFSLFLDAPRFVAAIKNLSVGNPPEPAYVLLAHPFTYLPFGSIVFKIQVLSSLLAGLTLVVLYFLVLKVIELTSPSQFLRSRSGRNKRILSGIFAVLFFAFSYQFWSQAQNIETFILVTFLSALIFYILLVSTSRAKVFIGLAAIALVFGLATGTNPVVASVIPAILWFMWRRQKYLTTSGFIVWFLLGIASVVLIHLYIPWRASLGPFLNYWDATNFDRTWKLSTGEGLNVYVPELGRINGFTWSPEVFFQSSFNFIKMSVLNFTPLILPFVLSGGWYLWRRSKYYFWLFVLPVIANFVFSGLYYSGNQESWFLVSFLVYAIFSGVGFYWLATGGLIVILERLKFGGGKSSEKYALYFLIFAIVPLIVFFPFLNRKDWVVTADYIENLYRPIGPPGVSGRAILFGSSDLFDSVSFYVHDVSGTPSYRPNVIPVTDNLFYIFDWYRNNLVKTTGVKVPDGTKLKYNSALEYSQFVADFFDKNIDNYKIFVTVPAVRNNFLLVYGGNDSDSSFVLDEKRFRLVPQGMLYQVVRVGDKTEPDLKNFEYSFTNPDFPKKKPFYFERVYNTEITGLINEYAYSLVGLGDYYLKQGKPQGVLELYQKAYELSPKNAEIMSRLGNFYGVTGDHARAAEYFEKALKLEPRNTRLLFNLALAYENTGKIDKAIARLSQVLKLAKPNSQEAQLAKSRLEVLRSATPSAEVGAGQIGTESGKELPKLPPGATLYKNDKLKISFVYPKGFKVEDVGRFIHLTNNLKGKDELSFDIIGKKIEEGEEIDKLGENLPFEVLGVALGTQPISLPGFQAVGKTYGSGEHLTFLILMRRNEWGFVIKVFPGDSTKNEDFSQILGSIRTLR